MITRITLPLHWKVRKASANSVDFMWTNTKEGFTEFILNTYVDTLQLKITRSPQLSGEFTLYGFQLFTDDPGFVFHSMGVNGAGVSISTLNAVYRVSSAKELEPDLVIFSVW